MDAAAPRHCEPPLGEPADASDGDDANGSGADDDDDDDDGGGVGGGGGGGGDGGDSGGQLDTAVLNAHASHLVSLDQQIGIVLALQPTSSVRISAPSYFYTSCPPLTFFSCLRCCAVFVFAFA